MLSACISRNTGLVNIFKCFKTYMKNRSFSIPVHLLKLPLLVICYVSQDGILCDSEADCVLTHNISGQKKLHHKLILIGSLGYRYQVVCMLVCKERDIQTE